MLDVAMVINHDEAKHIHILVNAIFIFQQRPPCLPLFCVWQTLTQCFSDAIQKVLSAYTHGYYSTCTLQEYVHISVSE